MIRVQPVTTWLFDIFFFLLLLLSAVLAFSTWWYSTYRAWMVASMIPSYDNNRRSITMGRIWIWILLPSELLIQMHARAHADTSCLPMHQLDIDVHIAHGKFFLKLFSSQHLIGKIFKSVLGVYLLHYKSGFVVCSRRKNENELNGK